MLFLPGQTIQIYAFKIVDNVVLYVFKYVHVSNLKTLTKFVKIILCETFQKTLLIINHPDSRFIQDVFTIYTYIDKMKCIK